MTETKQRLVVKEQVYFQPEHRQPLAFGSNFSAWIDGSVQPYDRWLEIGSQWQPIDIGWVKSPAIIFIANEAGHDLWVIPTDEQRSDIARRVLEIGCEANGETMPICFVPPNQSFRIHPAHIGSLRIRCRHDSCEVRIVVLGE